MPQRAEAVLDQYRAGNTSLDPQAVEMLRSSVRLNFSDAKIEALCQGAAAHWSALNQKLGRELPLPVALLDYLMAVRRVVHEPAIIERPALEAIERCAVVDPVMGLFNRQYLDAALERELLRRARHPLGMALLMLDLDGFKGVNDRHGHLCGDWILREFGALIRSHMRGGDLACRYGGDEVAIILPDASKAEAVAAAERIRCSVEEGLGRSVLPPGASLTLSGGLATFSARSRTPDALLRQADGALYRAKRAGGNRVFVAAASDGRMPPASGPPLKVPEADRRMASTLRRILGVGGYSNLMLVQEG